MECVDDSVQHSRVSSKSTPAATDSSLQMYKRVQGHREERKSSQFKAEFKKKYQSNDSKSKDAKEESKSGTPTSMSR